MCFHRAPATSCSRTFGIVVFENWNTTWAQNEVPFKLQPRVCFDIRDGSTAFSMILC